MIALVVPMQEKEELWEVHGDTDVVVFESLLSAQEKHLQSRVILI